MTALPRTCMTAPPNPFGPLQNENYGPQPKFRGSVDGVDLLNKTAAFIRRFVADSESQGIVLALWVAHTTCFTAFDCTPYLAITSAEKQSGKTRLLEVVETLVA